MYIATVPNRNSPPAILLRESYRHGGKVKSRTLANLSHWPEAKIEALRAVLRGGKVSGPLEQAFEIIRALPHGHVAATLGTLRRLELHKVISPRRSRERDLVEAMVVSRILEPRSKLSTAKALRDESAQSTLGQALGLGRADEDELYRALDWLLGHQRRIEDLLARRHLKEGTLVLYDVTSAYFEGRTCPLARLGHSRDGKRDKLQIVFGLLTNQQGCPVAVEVFAGNTGDPRTLGPQIEKVKERFGLSRVVLVGDRGMITDARIREDLKPVAGLDWITALRAPAIRELVQRGSLQLSLFDQRELAEITDPRHPQERLIVCRNPLLAEERARKRAELLAATEAELRRIQKATRLVKRPLRGRAEIALRVGKAVNKYKVAKHFALTIGEEGFEFQRREEKVAQEAALDGFYIIRTSVAEEALGAEDVVRCYKALSNVEQAFRRMKTVDLEVRPIYHHLPDRVRAHVLLCMLAYYVEWHMRQELAPLLYHDEDREAVEAERRSVVAPAPRSARARAKDRTKRTADGFPVQSFHDLLRHLATLTKNRIQPKAKGVPPFDLAATPTPLQRRAFELLHVSL